MKVLGVRWRLYRRGEPQRGWRDAVVLFGVYVGVMAAGVLWSRTVNSSTAFWAANGVLIAGILLLKPRVGLAFAATCISLNLGFNVISGLPANLNIFYTTMNVAVSLGVAVLVRTFCGAALDLGRLRRFLPFVGLVCLACTVEGMIGAAMSAPQFGIWQTIARRWATGDAVGIILGLPATLLMMRRVNPLYSGEAKSVERVALLAGLSVLTAAAFAWSGAPMILLLYPAVLFAAFRLGSAWAFLSVGLVAQIATVLTIANRGPIAVFDGAPPFEELGLLHLFLTSILLTASLATSALAERMRTEQRARRKEASAAAVRARADQMTATRERFLAVVSHEIRTPLNGIVGFAGALASRSDLDPEAKRQAGMIAQSAGVLTGLIEDILDFSRLEAGRLELEAAPGDAGAVLHEAVERSRVLAEGKGVTLTLTIEGDTPAGHSLDSRRLRQVVAGLVGNAVKFTDAGSVEVIAVWTPGEISDRLTLRVLDSGVGVPPARRGELFQPFAQLDPSLTRQQSGAGLGLAMCRSITELMGGEIGYAPREAGGSEFWLALDLPRAAVEATPQMIEGEVEERAPRILVVDDHPTNREVARLILASYGCDVTEADDGAAAVEAAKAKPFDAILMDVRMPGMDGLAATRAIRLLDGPAALTPILAVTADVMRDDVERCRAAGMNGHVPKPINPGRMMNALMTALEGGDCFAEAAPIAA